MKNCWLHISDTHFTVGDQYDVSRVTDALLEFLAVRVQQGTSIDAVFFTGDLAYHGRTEEYQQATTFLDSLLSTLKLERAALFVVPGNHDVDRRRAIGTERTIRSAAQADKYFSDASPKPHFAKMSAFSEWYDDYFSGIRRFPVHSTCFQPESVAIGDTSVGVLPINSALFALQDDDSKNLVVGRRCLDEILPETTKLNCDLLIALMHHPLDWLSDIERTEITKKLSGAVKVLLLGHEHASLAEQYLRFKGGSLLELTAGALYQGSSEPIGAMLVSPKREALTVEPIKYHDTPPVWTVDPAVFPEGEGERYVGVFDLDPDLAGSRVTVDSAPLRNSSHHSSRPPAQDTDTDASAGTHRFEHRPALVTGQELLRGRATNASASKTYAVAANSRSVHGFTSPESLERLVRAGAAVSPTGAYCVESANGSLSVASLSRRGDVRAFSNLKLPDELSDARTLAVSNRTRGRLKVFLSGSSTSAVLSVRGDRCQTVCQIDPPPYRAAYLGGELYRLVEEQILDTAGQVVHNEVSDFDIAGRWGSERIAILRSGDRSVLVGENFRRLEELEHTAMQVEGLAIPRPIDTPVPTHLLLLSASSLTFVDIPQSETKS